MPDEIVAKIKDAVDIVELIGESVRLERKGRSYAGLCPFHDEKTPSFIVSPDRQSWHCFGCGKGGDVFTFVMEKEGLNFPEALAELARRAGVALPARRGAPRTGDLYEVMEMAVEFFRSELKGPAGAAGRGYLARRNITMSDAAAFELGWAPAAWRELNDALRRRGVGEDQLLRCGLVTRGDRGCYDRFRGRVTFPIRNVSGRCVALGGRIVDGDGAKYLNSPEGPLYSKKDNLYLLDKAKGAIREKGRSILVEGYMDAVRLHMHGHRETVASLGTSLTEEQASLLRRFAPRCFICYDADAAGRNATLRGMYVLQRAGLQVYVVRFPGGKDPDETLQTDGGQEIFDAALEDAKPLVPYHIGLYREAEKTEGRARAASDLLDGMARLSAVELAPYMQEIGQAVGLPDYQLAAELDRRRRGLRPQIRREERPEPGKTPSEGKNAPDPPCDPAETGLLYLLWSSARLRLSVDVTETVRLFRDPRLADMAASLLTGDPPEALERRWLELGESFPLSAVAAGGAFCDTLGGDELSRWATLSDALRRRVKRDRYASLKDKMFRGEATPDEMAEYAALASDLKRGANRGA